MSLSRKILESVRVAESFSTQKKRFADQGSSKFDIDATFMLFKQLKDKGLLRPGENDIDRYKTLDEVFELVQARLKKKTRGAKRKAKKLSGAELVHEDDLYRIYWIKTAEAAYLYGKRTHWCIAAKENGREHFIKYTVEDWSTIYYALPKDPDIQIDDTDTEVETNKWAIVVDPLEDYPVFWDYADESHPDAPPELETAEAQDVFWWKFLTPPDPSTLSLRAVMESLSTFDRAESIYTFPAEMDKWVEKAKQVLLSEPGYAREYAGRTGERWPEAEAVILDDVDPAHAFYYARDVIRDRWPEAEPIIVQDPGIAQEYASEVIHGRWPEAEDKIASTPRSAYIYARDVLEGRFPKGEPTILTNPLWAYTYAYDVIKGRWPKAEPIIVREPPAALRYAIDVIQGRWPEAEPFISRRGDKRDVYASFLARTNMDDYKAFVTKYPVEDK